MSVLEWNNTKSQEGAHVPELTVLPFKSEYTIRTATPLDANAMAKLRIQLLEETEHFSEDRSSFLHSTELYFSNAIEKETYFGWIVEMEGQTVAMGGVNVFMRMPYPENPQGKEFYLLNLYTLPEFRRLGMGSALVQKAIELAKGHYAPRLWLDSTIKGLSIFEKAGFQRNQSAMELALT